MNDLDRGITRLREQLANEEMSPATRDALEFALRGALHEKERMERSPQPFYKDHG